MATTRLRECDMYPAVKRWLEGRGYTVSAEVPWHNSPIDVVGLNPEDRVCSVEMKLSLSQKVITQANYCTLIAHEAWIAVATRPRPSGIESVRKCRLGLLSVSGDTVAVLVEPAHEKIFAGEQAIIIARCKTGHFNGVGGTPVMKGCGPAQDCYRRIQEYRREHPKATWKEIYRDVPNHYGNRRSMQGAMSVMGDLLRRRQEEEIRKNVSKDTKNAKELDS